MGKALSMDHAFEVVSGLRGEQGRLEAGPEGCRNSGKEQRSAKEPGKEVVSFGLKLGVGVPCLLEAGEGPSPAEAPGVPSASCFACSQ